LQLPSRNSPQIKEAFESQITRQLESVGAAHRLLKSLSRTLKPENHRRPGTAVVLDNLATHRNKEAEALLRAHGCWFLFLPPYSPDLNPIEMAFSKLKAHLRRIGARSFTGLFEALSEICDLYTPQECWNYFCEAGYDPT
jgi:transposase